MTPDTHTAPITTIALRTTICTAVAVLIAWMALVPDQPTILWIDKLDHVAAFGALATVMRLARIRTSVVLWICFAAAAGIELAQGAVPSLRREMSAMDLLASCAGATRQYLMQPYIKANIKEKSSYTRPQHVAHKLSCYSDFQWVRL